MSPHPLENHTRGSFHPEIWGVPRHVLVPTALCDLEILEGLSLGLSLLTCLCSEIIPQDLFMKTGVVFFGVHLCIDSHGG